MSKKEMVALMGRGVAEAIELECKNNKQSICEFLYSFIQNWADDEFSDYACELCDKYGIKAFDDNDELNY